MKVAVLGGGTTGMKYVEALSRIRSVQVVGVCDVVLERAAKASEICNSSVYVTFEHMIDVEEPDTICVCLSPDIHKEYILKLAERKKHVICAAPISGTVSDAQEILSSFIRNNVMLFVGHTDRFDRKLADIHSKIKSDKIGKIGVVNMKRSEPYTRDRLRSNNESIIMELMIRDMDLLRWSLGEVASVYAMKTEREKLEYALVTLRFANGAIANLQGFRGYEPETIVQEFAGTSGVIRYDSRRDHTLQIRTLHAGATGSSDLESLTPSYLNPYADMLQHFVQCILKREQPVVTEQDAYKAVEIAAAALESIDKGVSVRLGGKPHE